MLGYRKTSRKLKQLVGGGIDYNIETMNLI